MRIVVASITALLMLVVMGCGDSSEGDASAQDGGPIEVSFLGGQISNGSRKTVELGSEVNITVTADIDDRVHVHGYDLLEAVAEGTDAEFTFTADIPGDFEVELEDSGRLLFELRVQ